MSRIRKISGFIISSLALSFLIYVLLIVVFPPRIFLSPYYILLVLFVTALFIFVLDFVLIKLIQKLIQKIQRSNFFQSILHWIKREKIISISVIMVIIILLSLIRPVLDNVNDNKLKAEAKQQFLPIPLSAISEAKIDRTLIELEKTLVKLRSKYVEEPPHYLINVYLFSDLNELITRTGMSEWSAGGTAIMPGIPPEIAIPVEKESSIWSSTLPTTTPSHEVTHVATFEAMHLKDINLVDRFYLEGMAEYESLKDFNRFVDRILNRIALISYKNESTKLNSIPSLNLKDRNVNKEDVALFYLLSHEFITYLSNKYGECKIWQVVQNVGQGLNFYEAFTIEYKKEYSATFSEFLEYFY